MKVDNEKLALLPFLTGSRAHGTPTDKSDIDMVLFLPDALGVGGLSDELYTNSEEQIGYDDVSASFRFGALNLLVFWDAGAFIAWKKTNDALVQAATTSHMLNKHPPTRDEAVKAYQAALEKIGLKGRASR